METVPLQVVEAEPGINDNTSPGNVSDTSTPVNAELVGLRSVIVNVDVPPAWKLGGEKLFARPISWTFNNPEAAAALVNPCSVSKAPGGSEFLYSPDTTDVTLI